MKLRNLMITLSLLLSLLFTACFEKPKGKVRVAADRDGVMILIDGEEKVTGGKEYVNILIEEGKHEITVERYTDDEEWVYRGSKTVMVGADTSQKIVIDTNKEATQKRKERLAREKKEREERLAREKKERLAKLLKKFGLSSYPEGVFLDEDFMLIWQDDSDAKTKKLNWNVAKRYCQDLTLAGFRDWRLPSKEKLSSLYKKKSLLKNSVTSYYWSSTTSADATSRAVNVHFYDGYMGYDVKGNSYYVRCVRAGQ
jgi:hypothetical protein